MNQKKLQYFEGIRGVAALIVLFDHLDFALLLNLDTKIFNFVYQLTGSQLAGTIFQSLISFFKNGNLAVFIFFFMSGYVISIKLFSNQSKSYLINAISKRYFRLMPPILGSVLIGFLLMKFDLIYNIELSQTLNTENTLGYFYNFYPSFLSAFKSGVWNVLFTTSLGGYNGPLWTMRPEFYGSLFCFLLFIIFNRIKNRHYIYLLIILGSSLIEIPWITSFTLGFLFCDLDHSKTKENLYSKLFKNQVFAGKLIPITICISLIILIPIINTSNWLNTSLILSFLLVFMVMKSIFLQKIFELKPLLWLGKISFSVYLLHWPIICSLTSYIYLSNELDRGLNILTSIILTVIIVFIASFFYTKYIDQKSIVLARKIGGMVNHFSEKINK